jgi:hypothetical protein
MQTAALLHRIENKQAIDLIEAAASQNDELEAARRHGEPGQIDGES